MNIYQVRRNMIILIFVYLGPQMCDIPFNHVYFVITVVLLTDLRV